MDWKAISGTGIGGVNGGAGRGLGDDDWILAWRWGGLETSTEMENIAGRVGFLKENNGGLLCTKWNGRGTFKAMAQNEGQQRPCDSGVVTQEVQMP